MKTLRLSFMKKRVAFDEVKKALEARGFELLDGDLTSQHITGLKKEQGVERLLHIDLQTVQADVQLQWEVRTVGLELKKHRKNRIEEALFERKLRHQLMRSNGRAEAAA
jgi:hypothetical protein